MLKFDCNVLRPPDREHDTALTHLAFLRAKGAFDRLVRVSWLLRVMAKKPAAKAVSIAHPSMLAALQFFVSWPDLWVAAKVIETLHAELDGNAYYSLTPVADALAEDHPLAAILAYRAMIVHNLKNNRTKRYAYAAGHLMHCASVQLDITDQQNIPDHPTFFRRITTSTLPPDVILELFRNGLAQRD